MTVQRLGHTPAHLVPIRLDLKLDNNAAHVHDTFCISLATPASDIKLLASRLCIDAGIDVSPTSTQAIAQAIQQQLEDARSACTDQAPLPGVQLLRLRVDLGDTVLQDTLEWDARNNGEDVTTIARLLVREHGLNDDATAAIECALREQNGHPTPRYPSASISVLRPEQHRHRFLSIVRPASPKRSPAPAPPTVDEHPTSMQELQPEPPGQPQAQPLLVPRLNSDDSNPLLRASSLRHVFDYGPDVVIDNAVQGSAAVNAGVLPGLPQPQVVPSDVPQDVYGSYAQQQQVMQQGALYGQLQAYGTMQHSPALMQQQQQQVMMQQQQAIVMPNVGFPGMTPDMSQPMMAPAIMQSMQGVPYQTALPGGTFTLPAAMHQPQQGAQPPNSFATMWG